MCQKIDFRRLMAEGALVTRGEAEILKEVGEHAKSMLKSNIIQEIREDVERRKENRVDEAEKTIESLAKFREKCAGEIMSAAHKLIRKADRELSRREKMEVTSRTKNA